MLPPIRRYLNFLSFDIKLASGINSRRLLVFDRAAITASGLDGLNNVQTVRDFTKDHMLPVEPAGDNCGDEKLGSITMYDEEVSPRPKRRRFGRNG